MRTARALVTELRSRLLDADKGDDGAGQDPRGKGAGSSEDYQDRAVQVPVCGAPHPPGKPGHRPRSGRGARALHGHR